MRKSRNRLARVCKQLLIGHLLPITVRSLDYTALGTPNQAKSANVRQCKHCASGALYDLSTLYLLPPHFLITFCAWFTSPVKILSKHSGARWAPKTLSFSFDIRLIRMSSHSSCNYLDLSRCFHVCFACRFTATISWAHTERHSQRRPGCFTRLCRRQPANIQGTS